MSNETGGESLASVLTEKELLELLGMNRNQLDGLRTKKGLPFVKLSERHRLYLEADILAFFKKQRMILNRAE